MIHVPPPFNCSGLTPPRTHSPLPPLRNKRPEVLLSDTDFKNLFAGDKRAIVNYHGYPHDMAGLVFGYKGAEKMHIEGYRSHGLRKQGFVKAIMWGHCVNDTVRESMQFQIITAIITIFVSAVASDEKESVLTAVQLLWITITMDAFGTSSLL